MYPSAINPVLGAGHLYFDEFDANDLPQGELYLGQTPDLSTTVSSERFQDWTSDGAIAELMMDVPTRVERSGACSVKSISDELLAMFFVGDVSTITTSAASEVAQAINGGEGVKQGHWYQLGVNGARPAGVRAIEAVAIKDSVPTTYTITTDYLLDAATGRIYIVPGGNIADDTVLTSDFDTTAVSWSQVATNDLGAKRGALRWVAANTTGENRDAFYPDVILAPSGDWSWKSRDTAQAAGFEIAIQKPADGRAAVYINGRAA